MSGLDATLYLLGDTRQERAQMEFLGIVVVVITQAYLWALLGYAYGHKDGKRVGYHRGRSISFNRYKENHG